MMLQYIPQANTTEMQELSGKSSDFDFLKSPTQLVPGSPNAQFQHAERSGLRTTIFSDRPDHSELRDHELASLATTPLNIGKQFFSAIRPDGVFEVLATGTINAAEFVQTDRTTVIVADTIRVAGTVRTRGHAIGLYCRHLIFESGSLIDTRGADGSLSLPQKISPDFSGWDGSDGEDGDDGEVGGMVIAAASLITGVPTIDARGGTGAEAQQGGDGRIGRDGVPGRDSDNVTRYDWNDTLPSEAPWYCDARPAEWGGDGGSPGRRGKGGKGGDVFVYMVTAIPSLVVRKDHGSHGPVGRSGKPAKGGAAAAAGKYYYKVCHDVSDPGDPSREECESGYISGIAAPEGGWGKETIYPYALEEPKGEDGAHEYFHNANQHIAKRIGGPWIEMASWAIDETYRRSGGEMTPELFARVDFLILVCSETVSNDPRKQAVLARMSALKISAALGLDYYGYSLEDAPLLSFDTYSSLVSTNLLRGLGSLENSFNVVCDATAKVETQKQALRAALQAVVALELELARLFDHSFVVAQEIGESIDRLDTEVREAERALRSAQAELEAAIKRASPDGSCTVETIITTAISVYVVVQSAGTAWTAVSGITAAVGNVKKFFDQYTKLKEMIDKWSILEKELKSIKSNYDDLNKALAELGKQVQGTPTTPKRMPSFTMQKAEFDKIASDFMNLPEAATFREAGHRFLDICQARLQAIVDYNAVVARLAEIQARRLQAADGKARAESELNRAGNPVLREMVFGVGQMVEAALQSAGAAVHRERKALAYHMNRPERAPSSQLNSAILEDLHRQTTERWTAYKNAFNPQLPVNSQRLPLDVMHFVDGPEGEQWQRFVRDGILGFSIRHDHPIYARAFKNLHALRFTGIQVAITGARVLDPKSGPIEGDIFWKMELGGSELVYPEGQPPVRFRHKALRIGGSSAQSGAFDDAMLVSNFSNDGLYAGLSPFTQWRLVISRDDAIAFDQQYDLSNVSSVKLRLLATVTFGNGSNP